MLDQGQTVIIYKSPTVMPPVPERKRTSGPKLSEDNLRRGMALLALNGDAKVAVDVNNIMADGRWRTQQDVAVKAPKHSDYAIYKALKRLVEQGFLIAEIEDCNTRVYKRATQ